MTWDDITGTLKRLDQDVQRLAVMEVALLAVVALVGNVWFRLLLVFAISILLLQQVLEAKRRHTPPPSDDEFPAQRKDALVRNRVNLLLDRIRELHAACHLMRSEQISAEVADERISAVERDLNRLLAEVVRASRSGEAITEQP